MQLTNFSAYIIAFFLLAISAFSGYQSGMFNWSHETVFYSCGGLGLLILLAMAGHRTGHHVTTSFIFTRIVLGILAMGVSLYYSWAFIVGGATGAAMFVFVAFVLVTEGAKILLTSDVAYYSATGQGEKTLWAGLMVIVLFCLSIAATAYNLIVSASVKHSEVAQSENRYQSMQARLDNLKRRIASAEADKANCPSNYITKCIKPAQRRIDQLRAQENSLQQQLGEYKPSSGGAVFWQRLSQQTGIPAGDLETYFAFLRGFLLELLGLLLLAQASAGARLKHEGGSKKYAGAGGENERIAEQKSEPLQEKYKQPVGAMSFAPIAPNPLETVLRFEQKLQQDKAKQAKKTVGATYQCVTCGADYQARTTWQKYCPDCGTAKRQPYAKRKNK